MKYSQNIVYILYTVVKLTLVGKMKNICCCLVECLTTEYSEWSPCLAICGKGIRVRTRAYRIPEKAAARGCNVQLVDREMCIGSAGECL